MRSWKRLMTVGLVAAAASVATYAQPASYPDRPIRIVVPSSAGSTPDVMARAIGAQLSEQMGQVVIVENKLGANQVLGTDYVAKAAPDGYTLLLTSNAISLNPALRKLPYDALRAFTPLTRVAVATGFLVVVNPKVPANTLQEFVAYATQHNGALNFSSPGEGNAFHLMTSLFLRSNGLRMQHIPYNSINLAVNAALAGDVQMTMAVPTMVVEQVKAGKLRALAFTGKQRLPELPDVPTMAEGGLCPRCDAGPGARALEPRAGQGGAGAAGPGRRDARRGFRCAHRPGG
jgi:tripartite-type tricarboxylate transporter receptor subunit TctC